MPTVTPRGTGAVASGFCSNAPWIRTDPFSHTRAGELYVSKDWLSEVVMAIAGQAGGWTGIALVAAAILAGIYSGLWRAMVRGGAHAVWSALVVLVAMWAGTVHWIARPHLATHLLTAVVAWQLYQFHLDRLTGRRLAMWLVPVAVLWPNLHGGFLNLFMLLVIYGVALGIEWWRDPAQRARQVGRWRWLAGITVLCAAVTLLNPYGWHLHTHIVEFLRTSEVVVFTREWHSPNFHSAGMHGPLVMAALLVMMLVVMHPRFSLAEHLLIVLWSYFALYAVRNVPVWALIVAPILAEHGSRWLREQQAAGRLPRLRRLGEMITTAEQRGHGLGWAMFVFLAISWMAIAGPAAARARLQTALLPDRYPVTAVEFLRNHPGTVEGPMFNSYAWGGFLIRELPDHAVFVDGRNDFYGAALLQDYRLVNRAQPGWAEVLARYRVRWTILPQEHALNALLELDARWEEVYRDATTRIYRMASGSI